MTKETDGSGRLILTNLSMVPGRQISETLGIAYGFASVKEGKDGYWLMGNDGREWPWADSPEHFEALFKEAEGRLEISGSKLGGDAIIKVEGKLSRSGSGNPEMLLIGTAVKLIPLEGLKEKKKASEENEESISFQMDGQKLTWQPPQATTPTKDVIRRMRERVPKEVEEYKDDTALIITMAQEIGISQSRARLLIDGGFDTLDKIINASSSEISAIEGINPTQARIIRKKAREMKSGK